MEKKEPVIHSILTKSGRELKGLLKKQDSVLSQETKYLLNEYEIENYGPVVYAVNPSYSGGSFRRAHSMMPFEYLDKKASDFNWRLYVNCDVNEAKYYANTFIVKFNVFKQEGVGLYIYSNTKGSGKTLLACCLLNEVINLHDVSAKFINILDYLELTKKSYNNASEKEEKDSIMNARILVLDDLGVEVSKDWINTTLYNLINYRYSNKLITIITSNQPVEDLKMDERIKGRIIEKSRIIHMPEISIRMQKAREKNEEFLKKLM